MKRTLLLCARTMLANPLLRADETLQQALGALREVGPEGKGNEAASAAWPKVAAAKADSLTAILHSMKGANLLAKNWIQSAVLSIAERIQAGTESFPKEEISQLENDPQARAVAYEILAKSDAKEAQVLLPKLLEDPSPKLRRLAVEDVVSQAKKVAADKPAAEALYSKAMVAARDEDQVKAIADELKGLGKEPDLIKHFGFFTNYRIIGPFLNVKREGFETVFPPEKELNFDAKYPGKEGEVSWKETTVTDRLGVLDFNKELKKLKEVTSYAVTEYDSPIEGPAEIRIGTNNAFKVWLNGAFVFGRDEYHRGFRIDQYKLEVNLKKGKNTILLKCCQNEELQTWTEEWHFQMRVCDATGTPLTK